MPGSDLYRKYRRLIEELADERCSTGQSLTALRALPQQFETETAALEVSTTHFVCDEIADQLEHEALRSTSKHRRDVLLAAVKGFDGMALPRAKP
jgi:hypothetical protein